MIDANIVFHLAAADQDAAQMFSNDDQVDSPVAAGRSHLAVLQNLIEVVRAVKQRRIFFTVSPINNIRELTFG